MPTLYVRSIHLLIWRHQLEEQGQLSSSLVTGAPGATTVAPPTDGQRGQVQWPRPPPPTTLLGRTRASAVTAPAGSDSAGGGRVPWLGPTRSSHGVLAFQSKNLLVQAAATGPAPRAGTWVQMGRSPTTLPKPEGAGGHAAFLQSLRSQQTSPPPPFWLPCSSKWVHTVHTWGAP